MFVPVAREHGSDVRQQGRDRRGVLVQKQSFKVPCLAPGSVCLVGFLDLLQFPQTSLAGNSQNFTRGREDYFQMLGGLLRIIISFITLFLIMIILWLVMNTLNITLHKSSFCRTKKCSLIVCVSLINNTM